MADPLTLAEARAIIDRAVEKATEIGFIAAFVVVDEGGNVISSSSMDEAAAAGAPVCAAKARLAALLKGPIKPFVDRIHVQWELWDSYREILPDTVFAGTGGVPIMKEGLAVGGFATGLGVATPGKELEARPGRGHVVMVQGEELTAEDYIVAHALQIPYREQHGPSTFQPPA